MALPKPGCSTPGGTRRDGTGCCRPYALRFRMGRRIKTALNLTNSDQCAVQRSCHAPICIVLSEHALPNTEFSHRVAASASVARRTLQLWLPDIAAHLASRHARPVVL